MPNIPVLVIEDSNEHYRQVEELLRDKFELKHLTAIEHESIFNFKAVHQDSHIVIVDLNLGQSSKFDYREGLEVVRRKLWPVDRTTLFVIFSEYIPDDLQSSLNRVEPYWFFVKKEFIKTDARKFSDECLLNLKHVVERCSECCPPALEIPRHETYRSISELSGFLSSPSIVIHPLQEVSKQSIVDSAVILENLSRAAAPYAKAGRASGSVAIGVYGSCGRMEVRAGKSDIEVSAYYVGGGGSLPHKELAVTLWNRLVKVMEKEGLLYEGADLVSMNEDRLLHSLQAGEQLPNQFCPVISIDALMSKDWDRQSHVRNRHLQTLTEMRAIFNQELVLQMKREMIESNISQKSLTRWDIIASGYLEDLCNQYFLDTKPTTLEGPKGKKRFVLRVLNLLALRLQLIWWLMRDNAHPLSTNREWAEFLDSFCEPGIVKVARFGNWCRENSIDKVVNLLEELVQEYVMVFGRFDQEGDLKGDLKRLGEGFVRVLQKVRDDRHFQPVKSASWLLNTENVSTLLGRL